MTAIANSLNAPNFTSQTLADGATVSWNMALGSLAVLSTAASRTINFPTNVTTGQQFTLTLISEGFQPTFASGYDFPSGVPSVNSVSGAVDNFVFLATGDLTANLIDYSSSVPNWNNFDGTRVIDNQLIFSSAGTTGGVVLTAIPSSSNVLWVICNATSIIQCGIFSYDANGRITTNPWTTSHTISSTGIIAALPQVCMMTDGLHAIVSFVATVSATNCQNLVCLGITGTSIGSGSIVQVRATEAVVASGTLVGLDTTNFGLVFRTGTSDILYAYPCSQSSNTITVGASPLTIETGNTNTLDARMVFNSSTTSILIYLSTVTATATFGYAVQLTWNGTSSAPTMGTPLEITGGAATVGSGLKMAIAPLTGASNYFVTVFTVSNDNLITVILNSSGTITSPGTAFTTGTNFSTAGTTLFVPDAAHCMIFQSSASTDEMCLILLNISSTYVVTTQYPWFTGTTATSSTGASFTPINSGKMALLGYIDNVPLTRASLIRV